MLKNFVTAALCRLLRPVFYRLLAEYEQHKPASLSAEEIRSRRVPWPYDKHPKRAGDN